MLTNQTASTAYTIYFIVQIVEISLYYTLLVWGEGSGRRPGGYEGNDSCTVVEFCTRFILHVRCLTTELFCSVPTWRASGITITIMWGDCFSEGSWKWFIVYYDMIMLDTIPFPKQRSVNLLWHGYAGHCSLFCVELCWFIAAWLCWTLFLVSRRRLLDSNVSELDLKVKNEYCFLPICGEPG
jgi:hypothetical protein